MFFLVMPTWASTSLIFMDVPPFWNYLTPSTRGKVKRFLKNFSGSTHCRGAYEISITVSLSPSTRNFTSHPAKDMPYTRDRSSWYWGRGS